MKTSTEKHKLLVAHVDALLDSMNAVKDMAVCAATLNNERHLPDHACAIRERVDNAATQFAEAIKKDFGS